MANAEHKRKGIEAIGKLLLFKVLLMIEGTLQEAKVNVKLLDTTDEWFGVTYKEDKLDALDLFKQLIADGVYMEKLFC